MKAMPGCVAMKSSAWCGLSAHSTSGLRTICVAPSSASTMNQATITGPKNLPMPAVPCFCTTNSTVSTTSVTGTTKRVQARRGHLQPFDRRQHRDGRGDDSVAEEDRGAEDPHQQQPAAQLGSVAHGCRGQRQHRDQTSLAVVVGAQDQHDVLDADDHRQRPEDHRQHAVDVGRRQRHVTVREDLLQGVQRAGTDIAIDHAHRAQREREQAGLGGRGGGTHKGRRLSRRRAIVPA